MRLKKENGGISVEKTEKTMKNRRKTLCQRPMFQMNLEERCCFDFSDFSDDLYIKIRPSSNRYHYILISISWLLIGL